MICKVSVSAQHLIRENANMRKSILLAFLTTVATFTMESVEVDWSRVKPLTAYPEFLREIASGKSCNYMSIDQQVSNGNVAGRHDFPFKAALITEMPFVDVLCGGSLISSSTVLTAAHCLHRASSAVVVLGASDIRDPSESRQVRFRVPSTNFRIHNWFREGIFNNDIGVVRLPFPIAVFTDAISPIAMPTSEMINELFANEDGIVPGFGRYTAETESYSPNLRFIEVTTMPNSGVTGCVLRFPLMLDTSHICTSGFGGRGWCPGDEGAPLVVRRGSGYVQIGVASLFPDSGCTSGHPSVYARTTSYLSFIEQNM